MSKLRFMSFFAFVVVAITAAIGFSPQEAQAQEGMSITVQVISQEEWDTEQHQEWWPKGVFVGIFYRDNLIYEALVETGRGGGHAFWIPHTTNDFPYLELRVLEGFGWNPAPVPFAEITAFYSQGRGTYVFSYTWISEFPLLPPSERRVTVMLPFHPPRNAIAEAGLFYRGRLVEGSEVQITGDDPFSLDPIFIVNYQNMREYEVRAIGNTGFVFETVSFRDLLEQEAFQQDRWVDFRDSRFTGLNGWGIPITEGQAQPLSNIPYTPEPLPAYEDDTQQTPDETTYTEESPDTEPYTDDEAPEYTPAQPVIEAPPHITLTIGTPSILNTQGQTESLPAAPFISPEGRTMVPLAAISTTLGVQPVWDSTTRTITIGATQDITISIDQPLPNNMGTAIIVNDTVFVPLRYIAEILGATLRWDSATRTIYIYNA